jgi:hypothetical protein
MRTGKLMHCLYWAPAFVLATSMAACTENPIPERIRPPDISEREYREVEWVREFSIGESETDTTLIYPVA